MQLSNPALMFPDVIIRDLGRTDYQYTLAAMQTFTANRTAETPDELWLTEHDSVYTLGLNRKNVRLPDNQIPVALVDRGGKITYHGIGQVIIYCLLDLKRHHLNVRQLVHIIETSIIELLATYQIKSTTKNDAPGVYVTIDNHQKKIASLGLRLKNNCCYHGLSLNVNMDLSPFSAIDPCGYAGLQMTQTKDLGVNQTPQQLGAALLQLLKEKLTHA
ncbi:MULTISPECIES: lipoyl(octanoyl) transferase LipB [Methylotenera]|uniref:lipoyl(octanoyl) transferase LipB n=1 Tax=Methylotenera TaxID=359407 RepID=UPI0003785FDC|nr:MULTISPECIES: lipoyl(octanoyl) transferase LipB [Methylotenera]